MVTKKKNPYEETIYNQPDTRQSKIDNLPTQSLALKDVVNKPTTTNLVAKNTGKISGFEYAPDKFILPKGNAMTQEQQMQYEASKKPTIPTISQEQLSQVGQLTPEQQANINSPIDVNRNPNFKQILNTAGEQAAIGAATGAIGGGTVGSVVPGAGTLAGAGIGAVGGGVVGLVRGIFTAYKYKDVDNVKGAEGNFDRGKESINGAITLARRGGASDLAEKEFNNAKAGILRTQRVYKSLEKNRAWATDIKDKQAELNYYIDNVLPRKEEEMRLALLKPDPAFLSMNTEVMQ